MCRKEVIPLGLIFKNAVPWIGTGVEKLFEKDPIDYSPEDSVDFGETEAGELYAISLYSSSVYRIESTGPIGYTFTGNGNWNESANWSNNKIPPASLPAAAEIMIDPISNGECVLNIPQTILSGGKLTVRANKKFRITGDLIIQ